MALIILPQPLTQPLDGAWSLWMAEYVRDAKVGIEATVVLLHHAGQGDPTPTEIEKVPFASQETRAPALHIFAARCTLEASLIDDALKQLYGKLLAEISKPPPPASTNTDPWMQDLKRDRHGRCYEEMGNIDVVLTHATPWKDALWYDVMCSKIMFEDKPLTDYAALAIEIGRLVDMPVRSPRLYEKAVRSRCMAHQRDRLQEYLASLQGQWDGTPRLETCLTQYAHVAPSAATTYISWMFPLSMVARGIDPGCDMRYAVIFEGDEDIGKGQLLLRIPHPLS
jgi:hypothetical protein